MKNFFAAFTHQDGDMCAGNFLRKTEHTGDHIVRHYEEAVGAAIILPEILRKCAQLDAVDQDVRILRHRVGAHNPVSD